LCAESDPYGRLLGWCNHHHHHHPSAAEEEEEEEEEAEEEEERGIFREDCGDRY
jgi:hypothetical protein